MKLSTVLAGLLALVLTSLGIAPAQAGTAIPIQSLSLVQESGTVVAEADHHHHHHEHHHHHHHHHHDSRTSGGTESLPAPHVSL